MPTVDGSLPICRPVEYLEVVLKGSGLVAHVVQFNAMLVGCLNGRIGTALEVMDVDGPFESICWPGIKRFGHEKE